MYFNTLFKCAKFQPDSCLCSQVIAKYAKVCRKTKKKKNKLYFEILVTRILRLVGTICFKLGMKICLVWGITAANLVELR